MLYILQFSTYLLSFLVMPYETRVLGDEIYGHLGAATSIMVYFQLVIDFGFLLSATEEVARSRHDKSALCRIFTSVTICKLGLTAVSFVVLLWLCQAIPAWHQKQTLILLTFAASFLTSMMPDYLYRGLEQMTAITNPVVFHRGHFLLFEVSGRCMGCAGAEYYRQCGSVDFCLSPPIPPFVYPLPAGEAVYRLAYPSPFLHVFLLTNGHHCIHCAKYCDFGHYLRQRRSYRVLHLCQYLD